MPARHCGLVDKAKRNERKEKRLFYMPGSTQCHSRAAPMPRMETQDSTQSVDRENVARLCPCDLHKIRERAAAISRRRALQTTRGTSLIRSRIALHSSREHSRIYFLANVPIEPICPADDRPAHYSGKGTAPGGMIPRRRMWVLW